MGDSDFFGQVAMRRVGVWMRIACDSKPSDSPRCHGHGGEVSQWHLVREKGSESDAVKLKE